MLDALEASWRDRRSIRAFRPEPIPRPTLERLFAAAQAAPSWCNVQPWRVCITEPPKTAQLADALQTAAKSGLPHAEVPFPLDYPSPYKEQRQACGVALYQAMGIARDDKAMRQDWVLRGFRQFDAPVCVIVTFDKELEGMDDAPFDCGAVATALVNAAWSRGLGAVINSQGIMQSPVVREHAGIADDQVIMKSIALGWPDESFPANAVVSTRKTVDEATTFVGFD